MFRQNVRILPPASRSAPGEGEHALDLVRAEAARVELGEQRGRLIEVRWGSFEGWIPRGAVRLLRTR